MSGLETEEIHAPAFGCGGHGEPVSFGLAFVWFLVISFGDPGQVQLNRFIA